MDGTVVESAVGSAEPLNACIWLEFVGFAYLDESAHACPVGPKPCLGKSPEPNVESMVDNYSVRILCSNILNLKGNIPTGAELILPTISDHSVARCEAKDSCRPHVMLCVGSDCMKLDRTFSWNRKWISFNPYGVFECAT